MPKFSVVISVYNKAHFIGNTLASVLRQTVSDFEIVIRNDGSTDTSEQVIKSFKDTRIRYFSESNQGAAAGRNFVIKQAKGEYIALLDADDIWEESYLAEIEKLITLFPAEKVFATAVQIEGKDGVRASAYSFKNPTHKKHLVLPYFKSSYKNTILTSSSTVLHNAVLERVGMYDTSIKSGQDTDLWVRIGIHYTIAFSTQPLVTYLDTPQSLYKSTRTTAHRPDWEAYKELEKTNPTLNKFIDLNRFSLAVRSKLWGEKEAYTRFRESITPANLNKKQRLLLATPRPVLQLLFGTKEWLERRGLRIGVF